MFMFKMDEIEDKYKSFEEIVKILEEYLQKMNEKVDGNVDKFLNIGF